MITALLIGFFGWLLACMKIGELVESKTHNAVTASVITVILFFLPVALFVDFTRMTT
jgi:putative effector of murein hydrolase LrgA (UPF0299 family)